MELVKTEFSKIEQVIQRQKMEIIQTLNSIFSNTMKLLNQNIKSLIKNKEEMDKFNHDIQENYNAIVRDIQMDPFYDIMQRYNDKLGLINNNIDKMRNDNIEIMKIEFKNEEIVKEKLNFLKEFFEMKSSVCKIVENLKYEKNPQRKIEKAMSYMAYSSIIDLQPYIGQQNSSKKRKFKFI